MSVDLVIATRNDNPCGLRASLQPLYDLILSGELKVYLVNDSDEPLRLNSLPAGFAPVVHVVTTDARLGLAHALNIGIELGSSEFIARLDVGDKSSSKRFSEQKLFLENNTSVSLLGIKSMLHFYDNSGEKVRSASSQGPLSNSEVIAELKKCNPIVHGSIMFRRKCFQDVGGYDEGLIVAQDFGLYMKFYRFGFGFEIIQGPDHSHDFWEGSSNTLLKNKLSRWNAMKLRLKYFSFSDYLSAPFIFFFLKDAILIVLPSFLMSWVRGILGR
jgi:glycosyltransferase involved in cell wall biosynthesis